MISGETSPAPKCCTVLVLEDHPLFSDALETALQRMFHDCQIRSAGTLEAALDQVGPDFTPDLVMLDLKLPDVTGISGLLRLRDRIPDVPIVVISALTSPEIVQSVMDAGAAAFIPKDASIQTLKSALFDVRAGQKFVPPEYRNVALGNDGGTTTIQLLSQKIADLTPQQARIMQLICEGKPNKQIAYEMSLAEATVKAHITALLRRLGVRNRTQAAMLVESARLENAESRGTAEIPAYLDH